jgi:hypothetical protein
VDTLVACLYDGGGVEIGKCGAYEREGRYTIEVVAPGYKAWTRSNVRVREDECHVLTQEVEARLQPE